MSSRSHGPTFDERQPRSPGAPARCFFARIICVYMRACICIYIYIYTYVHLLYNLRQREARTAPHLHRCVLTLARAHILSTNCHRSNRWLAISLSPFSCDLSELQAHPSAHGRSSWQPPSWHWASIYLEGLLMVPCLPHSRIANFSFV